MSGTTALKFLIKVIVFMLATVWLWSGDRPGWYHVPLAAAVGSLLSVIDPTAAVSDVAAHGRNLVLSAADGEQFSRVTINASRITGNLALLIALFLATTPPRTSRVPFTTFLVHFLGTAAVLFMLHVVFGVSAAFEGLMSQPGIMTESPFTPREISLIPRVNVLYDEIGKYAVVLLLWVPWVLMLRRELRITTESRVSIPRSRLPDE